MRFVRDTRSRLMVPDRRLLMSAPHQALLMASVGSDQYASSVVSLIHAEGADGSTTLTDAVAGNTWNLSGNAQIDTAQFRAGASSLLLDGTGDFGELPHDAKFHITGNLTLEISIRAVSWTAGGNYIVSRWTGVGTSSDVFILYYNTTDTTLNFAFRDSNDTTFRSVSATVGGGLATGSWHDIAMSRIGTSFHFFVGGTLIASPTSAFTINPDPSVITRLGSVGGSSANMFNGWLDEFRFTNGIGRYSANYTVTLPFVYP